MAVDDLATYNAYLDRLSEVADIQIKDIEGLLAALQKRHDFFASMGCKLPIMDWNNFMPNLTPTKKSRKYS
jgi:glucuronate isomerase